MLMTHLGSGICSQRWRRRGAILTETVPATIIRSAWRGLARKTSEPKRAISYWGADAAAIISKPQQASAYINGQTDENAPSSVSIGACPRGWLARQALPVGLAYSPLARLPCARESPCASW